MPVSASQLREIILAKLDAIHVEVNDDSDGCGAKFSALIVSDKFKDKPLLQRHRLVNEAISEELKTIHAFSQKTLTKEQWEQKINST